MNRIILIFYTVSVFFFPGEEVHPADTAQPDSGVSGLPVGIAPRFGGEFSGTEDSFTFGIIADRHGGNPLIGWTYFEQAVEEMNFLRPDFVIMPGDLIDGYIRREGLEGAAADFNEQFDEFARFANNLKMPLYFSPGNHDISSPDMKNAFLERFGRLWYSFDYRGVHFMALCTVAHPGGNGQPHHFTEEQVNWAIDDLSKHNSARHTVIFMHHPVWRTWYKNAPMHQQWLRIEEVLKGRNYTVIAGHTHDIATEIRHGQAYHVIATSGGSLLKPHSFYLGRQHHIGLVKMEKDSLRLTLLELGATHRIEQVSKTQQNAERITTIRSLYAKEQDFESEIEAQIKNPEKTSIYAEFSILGLSPGGWKSSGGSRLTAVIEPGDSVVFRTVLTVTNPLASYPPRLCIESKNNGLKIVDYNNVVPVFKAEDYKVIRNWYSLGPFDGRPMEYREHPFDPRTSLPALFSDFGPEGKPWQVDETCMDSIRWKPAVVDERGRVDLVKSYGNRIHPVGYAAASIESSADRMTYLSFAVNDYGRIWINGETVGKDIYFWEDGKVILPVWLRKGRNEILVKSANWSNKWYFDCKIADPDNVLKFSRDH